MEQFPTTILRNTLEGLSANIKFLSDEFIVFNKALCDSVDKANKTSDKMLWASIAYFVASFILSGAIAFSALAQAGMIKLVK